MMYKTVNGKDVAMTAQEVATFNASRTPPPATVADFQREIQKLVDAKAVSKQFNDGVTLASYANSTNEAWKAQALVFIAWRDTVWGYVYDALNQVQAGQRSQPTIEAFLAELPVITWP